jgi:putative tributyrin esterase
MRFRTLELSDPALAPDGLTFITVKSAALHQRADTTLYLPPEYAHLQDLPVLTLLHGVYASHWSWTFHGGAHLTAARLMRQGLITPMVLVMPSDGLWGDGSGYVAHAQQNFEQWIAHEVPLIAAQACSACSPNSSQAIAGLSMGGFAALRLAGRFPNRYRVACAHSAVTDTAQFDGVIEDSRAQWAADCMSTSVLSSLQSASGPLPALRMDCGLSDPLLQANRQLHQSLLALGIPHEYAEYPGGHDWPYWRTHLQETLRFVSAQCRPSVLPSSSGTGVCDQEGHAFSQTPLARRTNHSTRHKA